MHTRMAELWGDGEFEKGWKEVGMGNEGTMSFLSRAYDDVVKGIVRPKRKEYL